jgi:hypothetical protein
MNKNSIKRPPKEKQVNLKIPTHYINNHNPNYNSNSNNYSATNINNHSTTNIKVNNDLANNKLINNHSTVTPTKKLPPRASNK